MCAPKCVFFLNQFFLILIKVYATSLIMQKKEKKRVEQPNSPYQRDEMRWRTEYISNCVFHVLLINCIHFLSVGGKELKSGGKYNSHIQNITYRLLRMCKP